MKAKLYILALLPLLWSCSSDTPGEGSAEGQHPYLKLTAKVQTRSLTDGKGQDYEIKDFHLLNGTTVVTSQKPEFVKEGPSSDGKNKSDYWELKVRNKGQFTANVSTTVFGLANTGGYVPDPTYPSWGDAWYAYENENKPIDFIAFWKNAITSNKGTEELMNHVEWMSEEGTRMPVLMYGSKEITFKEDEEDARYLIASKILPLTRVFAKVTVRLKMGPTKDITSLRLVNVPQKFYLKDHTHDSDARMDLSFFGGKTIGAHEKAVDGVDYFNVGAKYGTASNGEYNIATTYYDIAEFYVPETKGKIPLQVEMKWKGLDESSGNPTYNSSGEESIKFNLQHNQQNEVLRNHHYVAQITIGAKETVDIKFYDATDEFVKREGVLPFD